MKFLVLFIFIIINSSYAGKTVTTQTFEYEVKDGVTNTKNNVEQNTKHKNGKSTFSNQTSVTTNEENDTTEVHSTISTSNSTKNKNRGK